MRRGAAGTTLSVSTTVGAYRTLDCEFSRRPRRLFPVRGGVQEPVDERPLAEVQRHAHVARELERAVQPAHDASAARAGRRARHPPQRCTLPQRRSAIPQVRNLRVRV